MIGNGGAVFHSSSAIIASAIPWSRWRWDLIPSTVAVGHTRGPYLNDVSTFFFKFYILSPFSLSKSCNVSSLCLLFGTPLPNPVQTSFKYSPSHSNSVGCASGLRAMEGENVRPLCNYPAQHGGFEVMWVIRAIRCVIDLWILCEYLILWLLVTFCPTN